MIALELQHLTSYLNHEYICSVDLNIFRHMQPPLDVKVNLGVYLQTKFEPITHLHFWDHNVQSWLGGFLSWWKIQDRSMSGFRFFEGLSTSIRSWEHKELCQTCSWRALLKSWPCLPMDPQLVHCMHSVCGFAIRWNLRQVLSDRSKPCNTRVRG